MFCKGEICLLCIFNTILVLDMGNVVLAQNRNVHGFTYPHVIYVNRFILFIFFCIWETDLEQILHGIHTWNSHLTHDFSHGKCSLNTKIPLSSHAPQNVFYKLNMWNLSDVEKLCKNQMNFTCWKTHCLMWKARKMYAAQIGNVVLEQVSHGFTWYDQM